MKVAPQEGWHFKGHALGHAWQVLLTDMVGTAIQWYGLHDMLLTGFPPSMVNHHILSRAAIGPALL